MSTTIATPEQKFAQAADLADAGLFAEAVIMLQEVAKSRPESAAVFARLGDAFWKLGSLSEAADAFREATRLAPGSELASLGLFHVLWERQLQDEALTEAKRYLTIAPSEDYQNIIAELHETWVRE